MSLAKIEYWAFVFLILIFVSEVSCVYMLNRDFEHLTVVKVEIPNGGQSISGLLYRPRSAPFENPMPAVILVHGISSAKESMSSIALELAKRNIVALTIDVLGHGDSGGQFGDTRDLSLGTLAAIRYLKIQPYVNSSSIGLVGHSLGAGAVRAAAAAEVDVRAVVLIAGGLGEMVADPAYGVFNSTFPKNLMVAIGRQDILFDLSQVTKEWLPSIFGSFQEVVPGQLYGDFSSGNARKLVAPNTTHLLEPLDPSIVSETLDWLYFAFRSGNVDETQVSARYFTYLHREVVMIIAVFAFVGLACAILPHISRRLSLKSKKTEPLHGYLEDWKIMTIWGILSIGLFFPMFFFGFIMPFPPLLFGSSIAWWLLTVGVTGLLFISLAAPKIFNIKLKIRTVIVESFTLRSASVAVILFLLMYLIVCLIDSILGINLWIYVPMFRVLNPATRIPVFFVFIPFFMVFFFTEGLFLHTLRIPIEKTGFSAGISALLKTIGIKMAPYLSVMCLQYLPMFLLDLKLFPSLVGFLIEFFPLITVQFVISTVFSWWFSRITSSIGAGAIFNTLIFAWISAGAFPFGGFFS